MEELEKRRQMSEIEMMERRYCSLRIAEYLETKMLSTVYLEGEEAEEKIYVENFLDPVVAKKKVDSIAHWREKKKKDGKMRMMAKAFRKYAEMCARDEF